MLIRPLRNFRLPDTIMINQMARCRYFSSKGDDKNTNDGNKNVQTTNKDIDQKVKNEKSSDENKQDVKGEIKAKPPVVTPETVIPKKEEKPKEAKFLFKESESGKQKLKKQGKLEKQKTGEISKVEKFEELLKIISKNIPEFLKAPKPLDHYPDGPRDEINFPRPVRLMYNVPVRHGFIPETFFKDFYPHTGYLGPYAFFFGFGTFLFSKEIYVCDHDFYGGMGTFMFLIYLSTKYGPTLGKYIDKDIDAFVEKLNFGREAAIYNFEHLIEFEEDLQWHAEGSRKLIDVKKENAKLLLESIFRERQMEVYFSIKKLLDYQVAINNIMSRYMMIERSQWVQREVLAAITPEIEIWTLKHNIEELKEVKVRKYPHVHKLEEE